MIRLMVLDNPRLAQAFIDYMASRQIPIQMSPEGEGRFALWLLDGQFQVETEAELTASCRNPIISATKRLLGIWLRLERVTSIITRLASWG